MEISNHNISPYVIPGLKFRAEFINSGSDRTNMDNIVKFVVGLTDYSVEDIMSKRRKHSVVEVRHICMWVLRKKTNNTMKDIGRYFNRDHSTVVYAVQLMDKRIYCKDVKVMTILNKVNLYI